MKVDRIFNCNEFIEDYNAMHESYDNARPFEEVVDSIRLDVDGVSGYDVTTDGSCNRCYTFEVENGYIYYIGLT